MFVAHEVRLGVGFPVALASLRNLATGCSLTGASRDAYGETITSLTRAGPVGATPGVSRLVSVSFVDPVMREGSATLGMRWNADGPGGGLFPALDANVILTADGEQASVLRLTARRAGRPARCGDHEPDRHRDDTRFHRPRCRCHHPSGRWNPLIHRHAAGHVLPVPGTRGDSWVSPGRSTAGICWPTRCRAVATWLLATASSPGSGSRCGSPARTRVPSALPA